MYLYPFAPLPTTTTTLPSQNLCKESWEERALRNRPNPFSQPSRLHYTSLTLSVSLCFSLHLSLLIITLVFLYLFAYSCFYALRGPRQSSDIPDCWFALYWTFSKPFIFPPSLNSFPPHPSTPLIHPPPTFSFPQQNRVKEQSLNRVFRTEQVKRNTKVSFPFPL